MNRGFGLPLMLVALAVGGALFAMQGTSNGPGSSSLAQQETQALDAASSVAFAQVEPVLQADHAQSGTYVGAELPLGSGVTLADATAVSYCIEAALDGTMMHKAGPNGPVSAGACP
jgi:hypothetical protein